MILMMPSLPARSTPSALRCWGDTPLIRMGNPDRVGGAAIYRATADTKWPKPKGPANKVERLSQGAGLMAFGPHSSGQAYFFPGKSPLDVPSTELPGPTAQQMDLFRKEADKVLMPAGHVQGAGRKTGGVGVTFNTELDNEGKRVDGRDDLLFKIISDHAKALAKEGRGTVDQAKLAELSAREFEAKAAITDRWAASEGQRIFDYKVGYWAQRAEAEWRAEHEVQWLPDTDDRKPTYSPERLPLEEMNARLRDVLETLGLEILCRETAGPMGPARLFKTQAGGGKTYQMIGVIKTLADADLRVLYLTANHDLAHQVAGDMKAAGIDAEVFGGYLAPVTPAKEGEDLPPDAELHCMRPIEAKLLEGANLSPSRGLCSDGSKEKGTYRECEFFAACQRKRKERLRPQVWVGPFNYLVLPPFVDPEKIDFVVVDETPGILFQPEEYDFSLKNLAEAYAVPRVEFRKGKKTYQGFSPGRTNDLHNIKLIVRNIVRDKTPGEYLTADDFKTKWTMEKSDRRSAILDIRYAAELEADRRFMTIWPSPNMSEARVKDVVQKAPRRIQAYGEMWRAMEIALEHPDGEGFARLAIVNGPDGHPALRVRIAPEVRGEWLQKPFVLLDATPASTKALSQVIGREVVQVADVHANVPNNVRITQILDAPVSKSKLGLHDGQKSISPAKAAEKPTGHAQALADFLRLLLLTTDGQVGLVASKSIKELLLRLLGDAAKERIVVGTYDEDHDGESKPKLQNTHYGKTVGINRLADVEAMVVIGCEAPAPSLIEPAAEGVFGRHVESVINPDDKHDWFYPSRTVISETKDGRRFEHEWHYHPNEDANQLLELAGRAQLVQGMERCRIARRGERGKPCHVYVFSNAPISYPVSEAVKYVEVEPTARTAMASHGFATESATLAHTLLPDRFPSVEAAKKALQRSAGGRRDKIAKSGTIPLLDPTKENVPNFGKMSQPENGAADTPAEPSWPEYRVQPSGQGRRPFGLAIHPKRLDEIHAKLTQAGITLTKMREPLVNRHPEISRELLQKAMEQTGVSITHLADAIGWSRENLSRWLGGKRGLPSKYQQPLTEWLQSNLPANFETGAAQQAVDYGDFPALVIDHLKDLPVQVANTMALRGVSANDLGKALGVPFFAVDAYITGRTTLDPERLEDLTAWLLDDGQSTFEQPLDALLEELLSVKLKPVKVPSLFCEEMQEVWPDLETGEYPGPLGPMATSAGSDPLPSIFEALDQ